MIEVYIFLGVVAIVFNIIWIRAARHQNGKFDKREAVQLLLGNITIAIVYSEMKSVSIDWAKWLIVLGTLIVSVGLGKLIMKFIDKDGRNEH